VHLRAYHISAVAQLDVAVNLHPPITSNDSPRPLQSRSPPEGPDLLAGAPSGTEWRAIAPFPLARQRAVLQQDGIRFCFNEPARP
jgi:hypothetical protein